MSKQSRVYDLPSSTKVALAEALVAKARLSQSHLSHQALDAATELLGDEIPDHIRDSIVLRRSILARLEGDYHSSERTILDYQGRGHAYGLSNARLRALNRLLLISHLENLIQLEDYETAEKEIDDLTKWEPSNSTQMSPSPMELSVNFKKWSTVSKIFQSSGRLTTARSYLDNCYPLLQSEHLRTEPNRFQIICRLSDLLCAEGFCVDARSKVEGAIRSISMHGNLAKASRRLKVSLLDLSITEGKYDEASSLVEALRQQSESISSPDISDQWLHLRLRVASARLLHYQSRLKDATCEWEGVISHVKAYLKSFEPEGFFYGLGRLSSSFARVKLACLEKKPPYSDSREAFNRGCAVLVREKPNYWIPTIPER